MLCKYVCTAQQLFKNLLVDVYYLFAKYNKSIWIVIYNLEISWKLQIF